MHQHQFLWQHQGRYNSYSEYFKRTFGTRVQKVAIDAGFTCPNRDGTKGFGGCTYCNNDAFNPSYCVPTKSVTQQISEGIEFHKVRYRRAASYLAYFQAYSNTYADIEVLKRLYDEALAYNGVIGLVIATRPDCMDDEKLEYFSHLAKTHYIIIEYGIESCYNRTLERINRGHTFEESALIIQKTAEKGIFTGAHIMFGLPYETETEMLAQADIISSLPLNTIKFHQLQIFKDTTMAKQYIVKPDDFNFFDLEQYVDFIIRFIERLNPNIVIERFSSEAPPRFLVSPSWGKLRTYEIQKLIEAELIRRDTWQGKCVK